MPSPRIQITSNRISEVGVKLWLRRRSFAGWGIDFLFLSLFCIWAIGGLPFKGHLYLKHGADLRRAILVVAVGTYAFIPGLREQSFFLRLGKCFWAKLVSSSRMSWLLVGVVGLFAVILAVMQSLSLRVTLYDVGIFHQILWSLVHGFQFHSTISGAGNFLYDHFAPSLLLLVPLFRISGENPFFLSIAQVFLFLGGISAWIFLALHSDGSGDLENLKDSAFQKKIVASTTVFALSFDSLWRNLKWGFHENALAFFALSWAFALLFSSEKFLPRIFFRYRRVWIFLLLLVAAFSKEILLLNVSAVLFYWAWKEWHVGRQTSLRSDRFRAVFLGGVGLVLIAGFVYFEKLPHPADKNYFDRYYSYLGHDLKGFIATLLTNPWIVFQRVGAGELFKYLWTLYSPWLFLPLIQSPLLSWMVIPSLASAALSTDFSLRQIQFHYVLEIWPLLASLTIVSLAKLKSERLLMVWVLFALLRMDFDPIGELRTDWAGYRSQAQVRSELQKIPLEASVSADELTGTWVAGRKWVTRWPDLSLIPKACPDYLVLRFVQGNPVQESQLNQVLDRCAGGRVSPYFEDQGWMFYRLRSLR